MAKVDLHVHSCYSDHPSEWFLQRLGARESYIEPEEIYRKAKLEGMDFVTITDHNTVEGVIKLKIRHPCDVFTGMEATTYFPEDGTKIHVLVWGLDENQFQKIDDLRKNIYQLRSYLQEEKLAHAVAHPTFSINGLLNYEHIERLFLLFDVFETKNGSRNKIDAEILTKVFQSLDARTMDELANKYFIVPTTDDNWRKGFVGGSDDHSGLFVGNTYTEADAVDPDEFLGCLKRKKCRAGGRQHHYWDLAFSIYKVAYDFSKSRSPLTKSFFNVLNSLIFDDKPLNLKERIMFERMRSTKSKDDPLRQIVYKLGTFFQDNRKASSDIKLTFAYGAITEVSDIFFRRFLEKIGSDVHGGDIVQFLKSVSGFLPGLFLSVPFFTSLNVMNASRWLLDKLSDNYIPPDSRPKRKVMWFTDTFLELSGVGATLQELAALAHQRKFRLTLATCLPPAGERRVEVGENVIDLPCIHNYTPEFFRTYTLRIPSILSALRIIGDENPDEIYISTPGPVGLLGILAAKLLHIPCTAVYHTDFTRQARQIIGDETVCRFTEEYVNWFYSITDAVAVSTKEYMTLLKRRGLNRAKIRRFHRGIDPYLFSPKAEKESKAFLQTEFGIRDGITLLHCGRVSKEKNMDFLTRVYSMIVKEHPAINLIVAGDGPYLDEYKKIMSGFPRVRFTGRMNRDELPKLYSASHFLIFPSVTETFGLVVLEAQSCGLPALVSDFGGPKEIIVNGKTGYVAEGSNAEDWKKKIEGVITLIESYDEIYREMRIQSRLNAVQNFSWDAVLKEIFSTENMELAISKESDIYNPIGDIIYNEERHHIEGTKETR